MWPGSTASARWRGRRPPSRIARAAISATSASHRGSTAFAPLVLTRGRTHDTAFEEWANKVARVDSQLGTEMSLADVRKDIRVELYNEAGQLVMAWTVYRCWPSEYVAVDGFRAGENRIAVESLTLQNEGWERDLSVTEPQEPVVSEE